MFGFLRDRKGATAVEFAIIAPSLLMTVLGGLEFGLVAWHWNSLQSIATTAARCVAIQSPLCKTVASGSDTSDAGISYVEQLAKTGGIAKVKAANITIERNVAYQSASFTKVTIVYPASLLAWSFDMTATGTFPNN